MTWESIALGALCVSQGLMWIRDARRQAVSLERDDRAHMFLDVIESRALRAAHASESVNERTRAMVDSLADANRAFGELRAEIQAALARLPRKRNRRVRELPPSAPLAPLERDKRAAPSPDPIGQVST